MDRQFGGVMAFDAELEYVPTVETAEAEIAGILDDLGTEHITVQKTSNAYIYKGELGGANLTCAKHDSLSGRR